MFVCSLCLQGSWYEHFVKYLLPPRAYFTLIYSIPFAHSPFSHLWPPPSLSLIPPLLPPSADGTPLPGLNLVVTDKDVGENARFTLALEDIFGSRGVFSIFPESAVGRTPVIIKVADSSRLDFENSDASQFLFKGRGAGVLCLFVYTFMGVFVYVCVFICVCKYVYGCMSLCVYKYIFLFVFASVYQCGYICIHLFPYLNSLITYTTHHSEINPPSKTNKDHKDFKNIHRPYNCLPPPHTNNPGITMK